MMNVSETVRVRPATTCDSRTLWHWRNDIETRKNSSNNNEIDWVSHQEWFANALNNDSRKIYIGISEATGDAIGMVRFDLSPEGSEAEVSLNIDPSLRGKGLSSALLAASIDTFVELFTVVLVAHIKPTNIPSIKSFEVCGFSLYDKDEIFLRFKNKNPVINAIEKVRARNNVNWMDLMRLAFRVAPKEAENIFLKVNSDDGEIASLLSKLAK